MLEHPSQQVIPHDNNDGNANLSARLKKKVQQLAKMITYTVSLYATYKLFRYMQRQRRKRILASTLRTTLPQAFNNTSLTKLLMAAKSGQVNRALLGVSYCLFQSADMPQHWLKADFLPSQSNLCQSEVLHALVEGGCEDVSPLAEPVTNRIGRFMLVASPFLYLAMMYRMLKGLQQDTNTISKTNTTMTRTKFTDVAGVDAAKAELHEIVQCLREPERFRMIGARPPRGVLLYGPSGTGKTLLARAVAGEACVPFLACSASDFVEMLVGRGAARIRDLFDRARMQARRHHYNNVQSLSPWSWKRSYDVHAVNALSSPILSAVIFVDEIDALAKSRGGINGNDEREQTLNQLLTEMDGFESRCAEDGSDPVTIIVLAASNRPECLDKALLRPGRFDRHVYVGCPDVAGREAVLRVHAKSVRMHASVDIEEIANNHSEKFSGADLENVINEAALLGVRDMSFEVHQEHLVKACRRIALMKSARGDE